MQPDVTKYLMFKKLHLYCLASHTSQYTIKIGISSLPNYASLYVVTVGSDHQYARYLYHVARELTTILFIPKCSSLSLCVAPLNIFCPKAFFKLRTCFLQQQSSIYPLSNLRQRLPNIKRAEVQSYLQELKMKKIMIIISRYCVINVVDFVPLRYKTNFKPCP